MLELKVVGMINKVKVIPVFILSLLISSIISAEEKWSDKSYEIRSIFTQAKRENPDHVHSNVILFALKDMSGSWLPTSGDGTCSQSYFYILKDDTHLYSLLLAAQMASKQVRVAVTNTDRKDGICRATMIASPSY